MPCVAGISSEVDAIVMSALPTTKCKCVGGRVLLRLIPFLASVVGLIVAGSSSALVAQPTERRLAEADRAEGQSEAWKRRRELYKRLRNSPSAKRKRAERRRKFIEACAFPAVSSAAKVIFLQAYGGKALSTVTLGGDDVKVSVADVEIEPGSEPLYIVLHGMNVMIWRFIGATDRVEAVVATSGRRSQDRELAMRAAHRLRLTGTVGIPKERVHIPTARFPFLDCVKPFSRPDGKKARESRSHMKMMIGREPDLLFVSPSISAVKLPSGHFDKKAKYRNARLLPDQGAGAVMWQELLRGHSGGLVEIDPGQVVSLLEAKPYTVLPEEAGIADLLDKGALRTLSTKTVDLATGREIVQGQRDVAVPAKPSHDKAMIVERPNEILILRKIRFPADMNSVWRLKFLLAPGVPLPDGLLSGICVRDQQSGEIFEMSSKFACR